MSGIAGMVSHGELAAVPDMARMLSAMDYRGPDGRQIDRLGDATFGFLRHRANPRIGDQPWQDDNLLIVADVRLAGRDTLASRLGVARSLSDPALILAAYRRWGTDCVSHLMGDFAFAIFDGELLFLARDPLGIKPLYYSVGDAGMPEFVFASEALPLARHRGAALNESRIADAMVFPLEHVDVVSTFYSDVFRLAPGSVLIRTPGSIEIRCYWTGHDVTPVRCASEAAYAEGLRETLAQVLREHAEDGSRLPIALSGGVDSTMLVGAAQANGLPVDTFSTVLPVTASCHESEMIRLAVSTLKPDAVLIEPELINQDIDALVAQLSSLQEPFDMHMLQIMIVHLAAKRRGHRFLIDGLEGEMVYSNPGNYPSLLYREGRLFEGLREALMSSRLSGINPLVEVWRSVRGLGAPALLKRLKNRVVGGSEMDGVMDSLINPDFARQADVSQRIRRMHQRLYEGTSSIREMHRRSVTHPAITAALERYDRIAALNGMESRHPLLDIRLVEFMLGVPDSVRLKYGWSKYLLRAAASDWVPHDIAWRRDKDENAWFFLAHLMAVKRTPMQQSISSSRSALGRYLDPARLDCLDDDDLLQVYGLGAWLERNLAEFSDAE